MVCEQGGLASLFSSGAPHRLLPSHLWDERRPSGTVLRKEPRPAGRVTPKAQATPPQRPTQATRSCGLSHILQKLLPKPGLPSPSPSFVLGRYLSPPRSPRRSWSGTAVPCRILLPNPRES